MAGVKSKLPQDITLMTAADRFLGSAPSDASAVVGYLASFAMTASQRSWLSLSTVR